MNVFTADHVEIARDVVAKKPRRFAPRMKAHCQPPTSSRSLRDRGELTDRTERDVANGGGMERHRPARWSWGGPRSPTHSRDPAASCSPALEYTAARANDPNERSVRP